MSTNSDSLLINNMLRVFHEYELAAGTRRELTDNPDGAPPYNNQSPWPKAGVGMLSGSNALFRLNYFNGRFLTAESLKAESVYWDSRSRLGAQVHPAGVAWGLDLVRDAGSSALVVRRFTLEPGLAFDDVGRPIVVGAPFDFKFSDLLTKYRAQPSVLVSGGTRFAPCACIARMPDSIIDRGSGFKPGAYLLLIHPAEAPEGEAKRYGEACPSAQSIHCEADGWRGGFGLRLAYLPVEVPAPPAQVNDADIADYFRGILSAYYFDVYEHALPDRWDDDFPLADTFQHASGPRERSAGGIPLALVYINATGDVFFVDQWIPRRTIVSTIGAAWFSNVRGGATPAAAEARVHQFQSQLEDSLARHPMAMDGKQQPLNLVQRGFMHIPPYGFLPLKRTAESPKPPQASDEPARPAWLGAAQLLAGAYFEGTNVFTYTTVGLHADDIFEDIAVAMYKDPVVIKPRSDAQAFESLLTLWDERGAKERDEQPAGSAREGTDGCGCGCAGGAWRPIVADAVRELIGRGGSSVEEILNREIEVLRIVLPMRGRDLHPTVAALAGANSAVRARSRIMLNLSGPSSLAGVNAAGPHLFAFYVKQRMVMHEYSYRLLECLLEPAQKIIRLIARIDDEPEQLTKLVSVLREDADDPIKDSLAAARRACPCLLALLCEPGIGAAFISILKERVPTLSARDEWALLTTAADSEAVSRLSDSDWFGRLVTAAARVFPRNERDVLVILILTFQLFGRQCVLALMRKLACGAPAGAQPGKPVDDEREKKVYDRVVGLVNARRLKDISPDVPDTMTVKDLMETPDDSLPGAFRPAAKAIREKVTELRGDKGKAEVRKIVASPLLDDEAFWKAHDAALANAGGKPPNEVLRDPDVIKAIAGAQADGSKRAQAEELAGSLGVLAEASGAGEYATMIRTIREK